MDAPERTAVKQAECCRNDRIGIQDTLERSGRQ